MTTEEKIEEIKKRHSKMYSLLDELDTAQKAESCDYHLVLVDAFTKDKQFSLFELKTKECKVHGNLSRIHSWLRLRNIPNEKVLNYL